MSHIETGKRAPSIDFFIKFSNLSGISLDYMLCCETVTGTKAKLDEITMRALKLLPKDRQFVFHTLDYFLDRFEHYTEK